MHDEVIQSEIHSTDAFGFSEMVFAVSHLLGFAYALRLKISRASGSMCSGTTHGATARLGRSNPRLRR